MLTVDKQNILSNLLTGVSYDELLWINGFINGFISTKKSDAQPAVLVEKPKISLLYGTETGNAKALATKLANHAKQKGFNVRLQNLEQYKNADLIKEEHAFIVISTQGDGEPPVGAKRFYDYIHSYSESLSNLKYAVLALGDSSYPLFCKAGEDVDNQLTKIGATSIAGMQKCDTDYEAAAFDWFDRVLPLVNGMGKPASVSTGTTLVGKKNKYSGRVISNINLNDIDSVKETRHIEIEAEGINYQPGDALSIVPSNLSALVYELIALAGIDGNKVVQYKNEQISIQALLQYRLNISCLPERVVEKYARLVQQDIPVVKIGLLDLMRIYPIINADQFEQVVDILEPIAPRQYSISSAPEAHSGTVHLTIGLDKFRVADETRNGLCSHYLSVLTDGAELEFSVHVNNRFRLPETDKDIIMIGPGTGVAPFRSFLAQREAQSAEGRNWLFFGEQHFSSDFLYQTEIQSWVETGLLTKVSLAFSRDQEHKIYVQHKIEREGQEFFSWLQNGAYIYLCGKRDPMSHDVENSILKVIRQYGGKSKEEAIEYLEILKNEDRFLKDVY